MSGLPDSSRGNPRFTPLMMQSFSRLLNSAGSSNNSFSGTGDSGYLSSLASSCSSTPSTEAESSSELYCSTPVASGLFLPHRTGILNQTSDQTPISRNPGFNHRGSFSEDRIPRPSPSLLHEAICEDTEADDLLSRLIKTTAPAVRRILQYLSNEDLLRLCQSCDVFCRAVCNHQPTLKRLSQYLISVKQDAENRATSSRNSFVPRALAGSDVMRPVNVFNISSSPGAVWTVPSPLETIDYKQIPIQLKALIRTTNKLPNHYCVVLCHTCRSFVPIRQNQLAKPVECAHCQQLAKKGSTPMSNTCAVPIAKKKKALFPDFR